MVENPFMVSLLQDNVFIILISSFINKIYIYI